MKLIHESFIEAELTYTVITGLSAGDETLFQQLLLLCDNLLASWHTALAMVRNE